MMRTLKAALTALVLAAALISSAASAADRRAKVPATGINVAHTLFQLPGDEPYRVAAENNLRFFALIEPDAIVDRNLAWVRQSDWRAGFKTMFSGAVDWARKTRQLGPDELYRLSREFLAQPNAEERHFASVASLLRGLAARRGHKRARTEEDELARNHEDIYSKAQHELLMAQVAKGEPGAMYLLAARYERAQGLKHDLAKAYYWLLRARANAQDKKTTEEIALALRVLGDDIKPEERRRARKWIAAGTEPPL